MIVGAVVDSKQGKVVGLTGGPFLLVHDTETGGSATHENPALVAPQHRRALAVGALINLGAEAVFAVPGAFCPHSSAMAARRGAQFIPIVEGTDVDAALEALEEGRLTPLETLPDEYIAEECGDYHEHHHGGDRA